MFDYLYVLPQCTTDMFAKIIMHLFRIEHNTMSDVEHVSISVLKHVSIHPCVAKTVSNSNGFSRNLKFDL